MPVYSYKIISEIKSSLITIAHTMFAHSPLVLTSDEFVASMIEADHVDKLREVQDLVGPVGPTTCNINHMVEGMRLSMSLQFRGGVPPIIIPRYVRGITASCPLHILQKIDVWIAERYRLGCIIGDALDAIEYLNNECGDARAMSLMLPAMVTIMAKNSAYEEDRMVKRGKKLNESKGFGTLPRLNPEQRQRLKDISALVNMAAMMPDITSCEAIIGDAIISVSSSQSIIDSRKNIFSSDYVGSFV